MSNCRCVTSVNTDIVFFGGRTAPPLCVLIWRCVNTAAKGPRPTFISPTISLYLWFRHCVSCCCYEKSSATTMFLFPHNVPSAWRPRENVMLCTNIVKKGVSLYLFLCVWVHTAVFHLSVMHILWQDFVHSSVTLGQSLLLSSTLLLQWFYFSSVGKCKLTRKHMLGNKLWLLCSTMWQICEEK